MNASQALLDHIDKLAKTKYPAEVIDQVRYCLIDYVGCVYAGSARSVYREAAQGLPEGSARLLGLGKTANPLQACLFNGIFSHGEELDDGHRRAMMHLGAPIFSALLAAWDEAEVGGRLDEQRFIAAAVCGYQAAIILGQTLQPHHKLQGFHGTGTCGTIGAALAIGVLRGYTEKQMQVTLALAATSGAGLLGVLDDGSQMKPYNVGRAAMDAYAAAQLGAAAPVPPDDILGGKRGFLRVFSGDAQGRAQETAHAQGSAGVVEPAGVQEPRLLLPSEEEYLIQGVFRKPYAACRHCHAAIDAARAIAKEPRFNAGSVNSISIRTYDLGVFGHDCQQPANGSAAKMSTPFCVAAALLGYPLLPSTFTDERCADEKLVRLAQTVAVVPDVLVTSWLPDRRGCIMRVEQADGAVFEQTVEYAKGEPENPLTADELEQKFLTLCASSTLPEKAAQSFLDAIKAGSVAAALSLLR